MGKDFGEYFVRGVAKGDGAKTLDGGGIGFFGDEREEGGFGGPAHITFGLNPGYKKNQVFFNYMPPFSVKTDGEVVWPRGFVWVKGPCSLLYFIFRDGGIQVI